MVKLILVSATSMEIEPTLQFLEHYKAARPDTYIFGRLAIEVCITGVGMVNTAFELGKLSNTVFDLAINAGVAGSFAHFKTGEVVTVIHDCFSELGAEDDQNFLSSDDLGFGKQKLELQNLLRSMVTDSLPKAFSITVNKVHGNEESIKKTKALHKPDIESMEGAAFIHAANAFQWKAIQVRAISNRVERRNKDKWDVPHAIKNLNDVLIELIKDLNIQQE
ncbi:MAG: futalosine hydrolase [bacterium]|nr:futalosine hydrolase [bacterium]